MQGDHSEDDDYDSDNSEDSTIGTRKLNLSYCVLIDVLSGTAWTAAVQTLGSFVGFSLSSQLLSPSYSSLYLLQEKSCSCR